MIILVNGPPGCGKDTAAGFIKKHLLGSVEQKMSRPLKAGIQMLYQLGGSAYLELEEEADVPSDHLFGKSFREVQVYLYERLTAFHGADVLARLTIKAIEGRPAKHFIVDCGLVVEAQELVHHFGYSKVALLTIERPDCEWTDYRQPLDHNIATKDHYHITNKFDLELYELQVKKALTTWKLIE